MNFRPSSNAQPPARGLAPQRLPSRARALQLAALTFAALCGGGYYALSVSGPANSVSSVTQDGLPPNFSVLLAGRDVIYCYYRQPCKDQNQRKGVIQTANTDTLMLVKVQGSRVNVLSIPRDTNVGDYNPRLSAADQKVNSKYWSGGPQELVRAVETITGERVDNYLIVRTDEVARVIDALGGLDVDVPPSGIEWVDQAAGVNFKLSPGPHHLAGPEAVWYLRVRKGFGDDYGRIDHQKQALSQLASKLASTRGVTALPTILSVLHGVETNLDPALFSTAAPYLSQLKLSFATLPTDTIRRSFNLAVNRDKLAQLWNAPALGSADILQPSSVTVLLQDASGANVGPPLLSALRLLGYTDVRLSTSTPSHEQSQVFTQSDVKQAQQLADLLGLARLQGERFPIQDGQVGILLGSDASQRFAALAAFSAAAAH